MTGEKKDFTMFRLSISSSDAALLCIPKTDLCRYTLYKGSIFKVWQRTQENLENITIRVGWYHFPLRRRYLFLLPIDSSYQLLGPPEEHCLLLKE